MCRFTLGVRFDVVLIRAVGPASVELQLGVAFLIAFASALAFADVALVQAWVRPQLGAQFAHAACSSSSLLHLAFAIAVFYSFAFLFGCLFSWVGFGTEAHGLRRAHCCCCAWPMHAFVVVCLLVKCIVLFVVAAVVYVNCAYVFLIFVVDKPSLQAFRAETMVERFTARMHVRSSVCSLVCAGGLGWRTVSGKICLVSDFLGPSFVRERKKCMAHKR